MYRERKNLPLGVYHGTKACQFIRRANSCMIKKTNHCLEHAIQSHLVQSLMEHIQVHVHNIYGSK